MGWKFWQKADDHSAPKVKKLPKPKDLPQEVGRFMVVDMKLDPDYVWELKCVTRPRDGNKAEFDVRVFDETRAVANGATVRDYNSLDEHPDQILFHGWYDKDIHVAKIQAASAVDKAA